MLYPARSMIGKPAASSTGSIGFPTLPTLERLDAIEQSLARYGCFDLVEDDVEWLIAALRDALRHRSADT